MRQQYQANSVNNQRKGSNTPLKRFKFASQMDRFDLEAEKEASAISQRNKLAPRRTQRYTEK